MTAQATRAERFRKLHVRGDPVVIFNAWDAGSARAIAAAGASAIGTGSWSVAAAHGYADGERLPLDLAIANLARIVAAVDVPVSIDLESGYGPQPEDVERSVTLAIRAGAIGINLEDGIDDERGIRDIGAQVERIRAARAAADRLSMPLFINARTDAFLQADRSQHDATLVAATIERAAAYAAAGASGLFVPCIADPGHIGAVCAATSLPVNVMMVPSLPPRAELARLGVARISHGPGPYRAAMAHLEKLARDAIASPE
ncbi:MAG: isocitrate lyase/phosphoenolpyruvate mutase family protein [Steroidobacteraceae bacterium]